MSDRGARGHCLFILVAWIASAQHARAEQHVILDATYTATAANTSDSHYRLPPDEGTPDDWRAPIDYAAGRAHVRLEVIDKPSSAPTLYNVCFEATPTYACLPYSPEYTAAGVYDYEYPFAAFYQGSQVDWSQGTNLIALILKDHDELKPQGDPDFYPTTIHVTITLLTEDAVYVPPSDEPDPDTGNDAAIADPLDAGEPDAAMATPDAAPPAGQPDAAPPVVPPSGGMSAPPVAGGAANTGGVGGGAPPTAAPIAGSASMSPAGSDDAGCSITGVRARASVLPWLVMLAAAIALRVWRAPRA